MNRLIHLIYSSAALYEFSEEDLTLLLEKARVHNGSIGVTGMLLYAEGSFFQILEGEQAAVDLLFEKISQDPRHRQVVTIMREPIAKRSFGDWTMGYTSITAQDVGQIVGLNDFFMQASCFGQINQGRAKKLLSAFKEGRWRTKLRNTNSAGKGNTTVLMQPATTRIPKVSFAYQPIIDAKTMSVVSFEALVRGINNESAADVLQYVSPESWRYFDSDCLPLAIGMAVRLGLSCNLNLNFMTLDIDDAKASIRTTLDTALRNNVHLSRIVLEIDQDKAMGDPIRFGAIIEEFRGTGVKFAIDHFGAGRAGLNLLEPYRPEIISLSENLVRGIESNGLRQAIVRGVVQTCNDLGIDIIAKSVETLDEYWWLRDEGLFLFQGNLFANPAFEELPSVTYPSE